MVGLRKTPELVQEVLFQAPGGSTPNTSSFRNSTYDAYISQTAYPPDNLDPRLQDVPLLPNRRENLEDGKDSELIRGKSFRRAKRPQYLTLAEAVHDNSQAEFDPRNLHPGLTPITSRTDDSFIKTPSPSLFPRGLPHAKKTHPFAQGFESPNWRLLAVHTFLCIIAYPILLFVVFVARDKALFWTRFVVSMGCGITGFCLGLSLLQLGKSFLEAATWATVIHQSRGPDAPGVKLRDLAANSQDPTSAWVALHLLWNRYRYPDASRRYRQTYDKRPWSLVIIFFLLLVTLAASLPFVFGRIIKIDTSVQHQRQDYYELKVKGDLSDNDIAQATALQGAFEDFSLTWTLAPFSTHGGLPPVVSFPWNDDMVHFSETVLSQLLPNGTGLGTFDVNTTAPSIGRERPELVTTDALKAIDPGVILRYPRWGIRIHCEKIPDARTNIVPRSPNGFTYVFTPQSVLRSLFSSFDMEFPEILTRPLNATRVLGLNDTLPVDLDVNTTASAVLLYDNGVSHSFKSTALSMGADGKGWISVENVVVRLNTTYTPSGKFSRYSDQSVPDVAGDPTYIGYDAAVCLELFEPWILETYNTTVGLPSSLRIVDKTNEVRDQNTQRLTEHNYGTPLMDANVKRQLNSTGLTSVYIAAQTNSINQMLKDNGRDAYYVPSPTVISFTGGSGPKGYIELSPEYFAKARALADASNILPYFAGTGDALARCYPDRVLSSAHINPIQMAIALLSVLFVGIIAGMFVPRLPLSVPRRGFELYSWLAAFHADELVGERTSGISRHMELEEIEGQLGELKFRYTAD